MAEHENQSEKEQTVKPDPEKPICGIIMPISGNPNEGYSENHWDKVRDIIQRAASMVNFNPKLVSDSDPTSIIQNNIINNIYYNEIVVCDVSSKNPNVMFELGLRLAFDKPVVIVKDDKTDYTFDIGMIQHLTYPKSLDFHEMEKFIQNLSDKIKDTYHSYQNNQKDNSFLSHFGNLEPQKLNPKNIDMKEFMSVITNNYERVRRELFRLSSKISIIEQRNQRIVNNQQEECNSPEDHPSRDFTRRRVPSISNMDFNTNI